MSTSDGAIRAGSHLLVCVDADRPCHFFLRGLREAVASHGHGIRLDERTRGLLIARDVSSPPAPKRRFRGAKIVHPRQMRCSSLVRATLVDEPKADDALLGADVVGTNGCRCGEQVGQLYVTAALLAAQAAVRGELDPKMFQPDLLRGERAADFVAQGGRHWTSQPNEAWQRKAVDAAESMSGGLRFCTLACVYLSIGGFSHRLKSLLPVSRWFCPERYRFVEENVGRVACHADASFFPLLWRRTPQGAVAYCRADLQRGSAVLVAAEAPTSVAVERAATLQAIRPDLQVSVLTARGEEIAVAGSGEERWLQVVKNFEDV